MKNEMKDNQPPARSFESALEALEEIVGKLERGDLALEESLELFEQGIARANVRKAEPGRRASKSCCEISRANPSSRLSGDKELIAAETES